MIWLSKHLIFWTYKKCWVFTVLTTYIWYTCNLLNKSQEYNKSQLKNVIEKSQETLLVALLTHIYRCSCDHCTPMPSIKESVCCQETHIQNKIIEFNEDGGDISCITQHPGFQPVCLDRYVLETAYYQYRQQYDELELSENEWVKLCGLLFCKIAKAT